ncbi:LytR C-terminal domain-containing protein [Arthrobacter sp. NPDC090010]|uniref:LytR C-terminal domain-containing protein n=1 Tax=Arthrobacter sp. NPDC090010 TaxID=3363942 RepID=UPI0037FF1ABB
MAKDPERLHGSHVVSGDELDRAFAHEPDDGSGRRRFRVRLRHAVVLILLVLLLVSGVVASVAIQRGFLTVPQAAAPSPSKSSLCPAGAVTPLPAASVTVGVFNATDTQGLAARTAAGLKARGFVIGKIDNRMGTFAGSVAVISGPAGHGAALAVQRQFQGADYVQDARKDSTVDVVLYSPVAALTQTAPAMTPGPLLCPREDATPSTVPTTPAVG